MNKLLFIFLVFLCPVPAFCQNVGVGTFTPEAILHLYNAGTNGAGSRLIFGDDLLNGRTNAYIGEWGWQTNQDSDILELSGFLGLKFTTGSSSAYTPMEILGDGSIRMNYLDDAIAEDSLVVVKPGGILAKRHVSSLPKELPTDISPGELFYFNGVSWQKIASGTEGQVLKISNGIPTWEDF